MVLTLAGRLDSRTLSEAWALAVGPVRWAKPRSLVVSAGDLSYCDRAGLGLFAELRRLVVSSGGEIDFEGLSPELQRLLEPSMLEDPLAGQLLPPRRTGFVTHVGEARRRAVSEFAGAGQLFDDQTLLVLGRCAHT